MSITYKIYFSVFLTKCLKNPETQIMHILKNYVNEEGISFSISISDMPTIKLLQKKFPNSVVPIYIQGQKFEDFAKANQDDQTEYMQRHLSGYHTSYQSYCEHITDYAKVVINDGDITDLSKQITGIISSYETSRDLSGNLYREYLQKAQKYVNYAQTHSLELN